MLLSELQSLLDKENLLVSVNQGAFPDRPIRAIATDSRQVCPGDIFVAVPGVKHDGHIYVSEAINRGASAVISQQPLDIPLPLLLVVNSRKAVAILSANWWGRPSENLLCIGITGTNGKTTTAFMVNAILEQAGYHTGLIGTILTKIDNRVFNSKMTTPDAATLQHLLHHMVEKDVEAVTMEVSSHGISQDRCYSMSFDAGVLTNITQDHHDLHPNFADYLQTKLRFFDLISPQGLKAINADDPVVSQATAGLDMPNMVRFGLTPQAEIRAEGIELGDGYSQFRLKWQEAPLIGGNKLVPGETSIRLPLPGKHNVYNALGAAAVALFLGIAPESISTALTGFTGVARRLQLLHEGNIRIIDDFAHNPASIKTAVEAVRYQTPQRIIIVNAIRGNRGCQINQENAQTLARCYEQSPRKTMLIITASTDVVGDHDLVSPEEKQNFLSTLQQAEVPYTFFPTLEEALSQALSRAESGDLILLLGAQGMDKGAELLHNLLPAQPKIQQADPFDEQSSEPAIISIPQYLGGEA